MFRPWYRCITMHNRITNCVLSASASISLMYRCTTRRKTATRITMYDSRVPMHGQYDHHHHSQHEHDPGDIFITHASGTQIRIVTMTMTMMVMEQQLSTSASTSTSSLLNVAMTSRRSRGSFDDDSTNSRRRRHHRHAACWIVGILELPSASSS